MIKYLSLFAVVWMINPENSMAQNEKLYYAFDPLCGWCFAFSPEMEEIADRYSDQLEIVVISGGMVTGERIGPIGETAPYIKEAYKTVEQSSDVKFGQPFLDHLFNEGTNVFSSIEPSIALAVVKELKPERAVKFASYLHRAVYVDGLPPTDFNSYASYAEKVGIDKETFLKQCENPEMKRKAEVDFQLSASLGVSGFPTIIYSDGKDLQIISRGFSSAREVSKRLDAVRRGR